MAAGGYDFVVVANRLPVDRVLAADGTLSWRTSPGGLVTAMEPVMRDADGAWVGWSGDTTDADGAGGALAPFDEAGMRLVPVPLSADEVELYYEGFSNGTLWPLYHDVIAPPAFHRDWYDAYREVNRRFADAASAQAAPGGTVWVQDYQLQLVPAMLREARPDLRIGFFNHIPFPPYEIFAQLPWRDQVIDGLLGADLIGFQRMSDANNFLRACSRARGLASRRQEVQVGSGAQRRTVRATAFPISIDSPSVDALARTEATAGRVAEVRFELGAPRKVLLGVDRLDYTKGITHRLKAYGELLADGAIDPEDTVLVQVATPSRERVASYMALRDEIELIVGRINGDYASIGHTAVHYLHSSQPREEMAALYRAADVMLVTALRDGMNLVAKEYVASRFDERGVLVLSEFTGAADELTQALLVNPHDINRLKELMLRALEMGEKEQARRMRALRRRVLEHDVTRWASEFLSALDDLTRGHVEMAVPFLDEALVQALQTFAALPTVLVALDFDGVLAPIVDDAAAARALPASAAALSRLAGARGVTLALVSGRSLTSLRTVADPPDAAVLVASHGAEVAGAPVELDEVARALLEVATADVEAVVATHAGTHAEHKPAGVVLHTRTAAPDVAVDAARAVLQGAGSRSGVHAMEGKDVVELSVVAASKGDAVAALREQLGADAVFYAGDDVTDETVLTTLALQRDVGIKVGGGESAAEHRVADPEAFAVVLDLLADLRASP